MAVEVGSKLSGKVSGITKFGAFIDLPEGLTGLVHISEVADNYVSDINEHLTVGDMVEVKVLTIEQGGKIALSIKKAKERERPASNRQQSTKGGRPNNFNTAKTVETFDQKMSRFLKDSEERLASLKRNTEHKRGGRGGRRS
ncbi:MAG: binding domain protein [Bacillales bacterium]|jgi:S1 RNA binding domain protein|nr:binding domain protein [Bacillales bacterium]